MPTTHIAPCPKCGVMVQAETKGQLCAGCQKTWNARPLGGREFHDAENLRWKQYKREVGEKC